MMVSFSLHCVSTALAALLLPSLTLSSPFPQASRLSSTENTFRVAGSTNSLTVQVNFTNANPPPPSPLTFQNINATLAALFSNLQATAASSGSKYTVLQNPTNVTVNGATAGIASSPVPAHIQRLTYSDAALVVHGLQEFLTGKTADLGERIDFAVNATIPLESSVFGQTTILVATGFVDSETAGGGSLESGVFEPGQMRAPISTDK